ncbi:MAG TPA: hypothetical protein VNO75_02795 [Gemmatimonadaceae bacterium]|nr:hypothetical protein [Gemmatimonadaceae bacterium]
MVLIRPVLLLLAAAGIACAPPASSGRAARNANLITQAELTASGHTNLYDAIANLRPAFFRSRGRSTFDNTVSDYPPVYQDGQRYGEIETLRSISIEHVKQVRFLSASDATTKYGTNHTAGAIEVVTR